MNNINLDDLKKIRVYCKHNLSSIDDTIKSIEVPYTGFLVTGIYKKQMYSVFYSLETEEIEFYVVNVMSSKFYRKIETRGEFIPSIKGAIHSLKILIDRS